MTDKTTYLTREGRVKLEAELEQLVTVERKQVAERIAAAKELGDISESGEYEDAKKSQALLELIMLRRTKEGVRDQLSVPRREEMTREYRLGRIERIECSFRAVVQSMCPCHRLRGSGTCGF